MKKIILLTLMFGMMFLVLSASAQEVDCEPTCFSDTPSEKGITPVQEPFPGGDPICQGEGYRFDNPTKGESTWNDGMGNSITIIISDSECGEVLDWSVTGDIVVDQVFVKGGTDQNVYDYDGEISDGNLHAPVVSSGKYADVSHVDFCYRLKDNPSLDLEKSTNGEDADEPPGLEILEGGEVTWTFTVTNTGNVTLTDILVTDDHLGEIGVIDVLMPGESETLEKTGTAECGQYANVGTAAAVYEQTEVSDSDPSHYFGACPDIDIEKWTNGEDADEPTGPEVTVGGPVFWTYIVKNIGNVPLSDVKIWDDKLGVDPICEFKLLDPGQEENCQQEGIAIEGQYTNLGTAVGWWNEEKVFDLDPSHYLGRPAECEPDDFAVVLSFKDKDGNYVGGVLAYLTAPPDTWKKSMKILSSPTEIMAGGMWPGNAQFTFLDCIPCGTWKMNFVPPTGYQFVSPDHMEFEVSCLPDDEDYRSEGFYLVGLDSPVLYLEKTDGVQGTSVTPAEPAEPEVIIPNNLAPAKLEFVQGTPTFKNEGWDKAVDGVLEGWKGTTTAKHDKASDTAPFGIFKFVDGGIYQFTRFMIQTDNGPNDDKWSSRHAALVDVQVSKTGILPENFTSLGQFRTNRTDMMTFKLPQIVQAKYIKLVLLQPDYSPWIQLVEFAIANNSKDVAGIKSEELPIIDLPRDYRLAQNYPNPFNPVTTISYDLPAESQVRLVVYDTSGKIVATLVDGLQSAGDYQVHWNASTVPSGLYFYRMTAGSFTKTQRMVLMK